MLFNVLLMIVLVHSIFVSSEISNSLPIITTRIIKGHRSKPGQFPWHANLSLKMSDGSFAICGGSLISENWIITAAHCTEHAKEIKVGLGIKNAVEYQFTTSVKEIIIHEEYDTKYLQYDISLLKLASRVPMKRLISIIRLPPKSIELPSNLTGTVCGFGKFIDNSGTRRPAVLLWLKIRLITNDQCTLIFGPDFVTDLKICANGFDPTQNICDGDSGGGLVAQIKDIKYLIGITSFGRIDKCVGAPAGYQLIHTLVDWINEKIAKSK